MPPGVLRGCHTGTVAPSSPNWKILLSPPEVGPAERSLLLDAFDSGWVAPAGPDIDAFESELAELTGTAAVAALSSGTAALHLGLMAVGVRAGDDVLVSTLTFGASAFAVTYLGARPCFVDCEPSTWHLDPDLLADELARRADQGRLPAAVVAVDLYGSVADERQISLVCEQYGVPLVEDAAEALGARRDGSPAGSFGRVAVLSFNGNKIATTGGGGALASNDIELVARVRKLSTQAREPVPWYEHEHIGFNYRMGNLNAAVGRGQLTTLPERISQRRRVREQYEARLGAAEGIRFQEIPEGCEPNHWLTTVAFDPSAFGAAAADVLHALRNAGIEARHGFKPMHLQPVFSDSPVVGGEVAATLFDTSVSLPSGARLTEADVDWICDVVFATRS
jgi:dTDP-4-amino-4,6-dideoxygalactose transaminase